MFTSLTMRGGSASILWGCRTAVALRSWAIKKNPKGQWSLTATVERVDAFQARQRPLLFTAPRKGGFWMWPIVSLTVGPSQLVAELGPPEQ